MNKRAEIFYKGQTFIFNIYSLMPQEQRWKRILNEINYLHVMGFWVLLFDLLLVVHVVANLNNMFEIVRAIFVLATSAGHTTKLISIKMNNVALQQLFERLDDEDFRAVGAEELAIFAAACETTRKARDYYAALSLLALAMILISQFVLDWSQLPVGTYNPFVDGPGSAGYWLLYCYQCLALSTSCLTNIAFDSLCCSLFIFVKCQLNILALRLQHLGKANTSIDVQLRQCIRYHMAIVDLAENIERLFCQPISMQIFCSVLVLTANFYAIAMLSDEKLALFKFVSYQACMLIQIFMLCYFAGEIIHCSVGLPHRLYDSNWMDWNRCDRRNVLLFMQRLHYELRIRTINPSRAFDLALFGSWQTFSMNQHQRVAAHFYKHQVWYLQLLGIWALPSSATDQHRRWHLLRFCLIFVILSGMLLLFAMELVSSISNLRAILRVFFMFATEMSCMTKLMHLKLKGRKLAGLVSMMESSRFATKSEQEQNLMEAGRVSVVNLRNLYGVSSIVTATLILVVPCFAGCTELPLSMYELCSIEGRACYWVLFLTHAISLLPTCCLNIAFDSVAFSLLTYLRVQVQMLVLRLQKLGPADGPLDNQRINRELRECSAYYNNIVRLKDLVEMFIRVPGSVQLMCSILVLVSNLYDMSTISIANGEAIYMTKTCIYQLVMLLQIFIICYPSNEVTIHSSRLSHSVYMSQWTTWDKRNRQIILLMMQRLGSPLCLRTLNPTFTFSLEAFGSIVNCSYSYFALLKRVNS
ncbi:blast:Odorant receptor 46a%2C isoform B [Drosophila guanche]|uniref:Blast:Odorant receptor 46a, isoform B n=1 Tax=Drosophila guanche TaxID=7266 RepID=A0A3B0IZX9_DROGU|nr:blast:Odorant receptor 46a%2C isoform B [Drosophila guanche]